MKDVWHEIEFHLGMKRTSTGEVRFYRAWLGEPESIDASIRVLKVRLQIPESMWELPTIRGKVKSDLKEEYDMFLTELGHDIEENNEN